jgi:hypothetical protein
MLWREHRLRLRRRSIWVRFLHFVLAFAILSFGALMAQAAEEWLGHGPPHLANTRWLFLFGTLAAFLLFLLLTRQQEHRLEHPFDVERRSLRQVSLQKAKPDTNVKSLIMFVSTPDIVPELQIDPSTKAANIFIKAPKSGGACRLAGVSVANDIASFDFRWNWQQMLRAIEPHAGLESVWLIGSLDGDGKKTESPEPAGAQLTNTGRGSYAYLELCKQMLELYLPNARIESVHEAVSFEDFNDLEKTVRMILHTNLRHVPEDKIILEVTGGTKVASIAGAALTLANELRFQYVQTTKPFSPIRYDLVMEKIPTIDLI